MQTGEQTNRVIIACIGIVVLTGLCCFTIMLAV